VNVTQFITNILKVNAVVSKLGGMVVLLANGGTLIYKLWHGSGD
jgi:sRNA-binding regulator protein Hfq